MPDRFDFKTCSCGKRFTVEEWRQLHRCGIVDVEREYPRRVRKQRIPPFELRTCSECGSTVSKPIPYRGGSDYPPPLHGPDVEVPQNA